MKTVSITDVKPIAGRSDRSAVAGATRDDADPTG
jgi:hypothetical protein